MKREISRLTAVLIIGMVIGGAFVNVLIAGQVERITLANNALQDEVSNLQWELQEANKSLASKKKQVVSGVDVFVVVTDKELLEYEEIKVHQTVGKKIKEWLQPLIGQEIDSIDYLLIPRIVDNRVVDVEGDEYQLEVNLLVVGQRIGVYVMAKHRPKTSGQ